MRQFVDMKKSILTRAVKLIFLKRWKNHSMCFTVVSAVKETSRQPDMQKTVIVNLLSTHKNARQPEYI